MSVSKTEKYGSLSVNAPRGTEISVYDERYKRVALELSNLFIKLPAGAYEVAYDLLGLQASETIYLSEDDYCVLSAPASVRLRGIAPVTSSTDRETPIARRYERKIKQGYKRARKVDCGSGGEIFIFVRAIDVKSQIDLGRSIKLFDANQKPLSDFNKRRNARAKISVRPGRWAAFRVSLDPGIYYLRLSEPGFNERVIPVFGGMRTDVYLGYSRDRSERYGLQPEKATVTAVEQAGRDDITADFIQYVSHLEHIELLTAGLATGRLTLSPVQMKAFGEKASRDPFANLLVAANAIAALRRRDRYRSVERSSSSMRRLRVLDGLIKEHEALDLAKHNSDELLEQTRRSLEGVAFLPDAVLFQAWLEKRNLSSINAQRLKVNTPPLLNLSYALAVERSLEEPDTFEDGTLISAAGDARDRSLTWFSWEREIKGAKDPSKTPSRDNLEAAGKVIVDFFNARTEQKIEDSDVALEFLKKHAGLLSAASRLFAINQGKLVAVRTGNEVAPDKAVALLAQSLKTPAVKLRDQLVQLKVDAAVAESLAEIGMQYQPNVTIKNAFVDRDPDWPLAYASILDKLSADRSFGIAGLTEQEQRAAPNWLWSTFESKLGRRAIDGE